MLRADGPAMIAGYLRKSDAFGRAIGELAQKYADKNKADHAALPKAVKSGRVKADTEAVPVRPPTLKMENWFPVAY